MKIHSIIRRNRDEVPELYGDRNDLFSLQHDMNQLFDEFFGGLGLMPARGVSEPLAMFSPRLDCSETEKEIKVTAELPGLTEKDVEITLEENTLTIKGEKKAEQEGKTAHSYRIERTYGTFKRVIPLNAKIRDDGVKAGMKNGVLTVTLTKAEPEKSRGQKIQIVAE